MGERQGEMERLGEIDTWLIYHETPFVNKILTQTPIHHSRGLFHLS